MRVREEIGVSGGRGEDRKLPGAGRSQCRPDRPDFELDKHREHSPGAPTEGGRSNGQGEGDRI